MNKKQGYAGSSGVVEVIQQGANCIDRALPCQLLFLEVWPVAVEAEAGNLHREGVLVRCKLSPGSDLPPVGAIALVSIDLPQHRSYAPKVIDCETTLVEIFNLGGSSFQFGLQILRADFRDRYMLPSQQTAELISQYVM